MCRPANTFFSDENARRIETAAVAKKDIIMPFVFFRGNEYVSAA